MIIFKCQKIGRRSC